MNKEEKKKLDFEVVKILNDNGILNYLQAGMIADIADAVQQSDFDSMKPYKTFKTDIDSKLAEEIVFEYLSRHNMKHTIQCIVSESGRQLAPKVQPTGNIKNRLGIDANDNYISYVMDEYQQKQEEIFKSYFTNLRNQINERAAGYVPSQSVEPSQSQDFDQSQGFDQSQATDQYVTDQDQAFDQTASSSQSKSRHRSKHHHHRHSARGSESNQFDDAGDFE